MMDGTATSPDLAIVWRKIDSLRPYARNTRTHDDEQIATLVASMLEFGWSAPCIVAGDELLAGHARLEAARRIWSQGKHILGTQDGMVPCVDMPHLSAEQRRALIIADNRLAEKAGWDLALLREELTALQQANFSLPTIGFGLKDMDELFGATAEGDPASLADKFGAPPFSVFDARAGWWQDRKRAWLALGIQSELGRGGNLLKMSDTVLQPDAKKRRSTAARTFSQDLMKGENPKFGNGSPDANYTGTSVFDPVLCELCYRWFCPPRGLVLDPFAGGSVRGIVASRLGRRYFGVDLAKDQLEANRLQGHKICQDDMMPLWVEGDSRGIGEIARRHRPWGKSQNPGADFIFSCPPYGDLERYSDDVRDLSTMEWAKFEQALTEVVAGALGALRDNRFAAFVVGDFRDKAGMYRGFPSAVIEAFEHGGARLYNEAILVTAVGSLPIRMGKGFEASRKLGKTHQNVLVFVKGDPVKATAVIGDVEFGDVFTEAGEAAEPHGDQAPPPKLSLKTERQPQHIGGEV